MPYLCCSERARILARDQKSIRICIVKRSAAAAGTERRRRPRRRPTKPKQSTRWTVLLARDDDDDDEPEPGRKRVHHTGGLATPTNRMADDDDGSPHWSTCCRLPFNFSLFPPERRHKSSAGAREHQPKEAASQEVESAKERLCCGWKK